VQLIFVALGRR